MSGGDPIALFFLEHGIDAQSMVLAFGASVALIALAAFSVWLFSPPPDDGSPPRDQR